MFNFFFKKKYYFLILFLLFFYLFFHHKLFAQNCTIEINKTNNSKERTVFISGGSATELFQTYLKELESKNIKIPLSKIHVNLWDGSKNQEYSQNWRDMLTGQGVRERWDNILKDVYAKNDEVSLKKAYHHKWDVVCIPEMIEAQPPELPKIPESPKTSELPKTPEPTLISITETKNSISLEAKMNLQQGLNYIKLRDFDNAINEFSLAIQKDPNFTVAYANRAVAYMQIQKYNKALDDLIAAQKISPKDANLHYNYIALYSLQNQLDRALDSLDEALTNGFSDYDSLRHDPDLKNVRKHPEFRKICEKHKVFLK